MNWRWKTAIVLSITYDTVARYCAFKMALGLATTHCGCGP